MTTIKTHLEITRKWTGASLPNESWKRHGYKHGYTACEWCWFLRSRVNVQRLPSAICIHRRWAALFSWARISPRSQALQAMQGKPGGS